MLDKKTILLVEDDKNIKEIYADEFEEKGYEVIAVDDGKKALNLLDEKLPDIIILDIKLPEREGTEILKDIRKKNIPIPIIICTGFPFTAAHNSIYKKLANSVITKPVDLDILTKKVEELTKK